jgi:hypothetical protein
MMGFGIIPNLILGLLKTKKIQIFTICISGGCRFRMAFFDQFSTAQNATQN